MNIKKNGKVSKDKNKSPEKTTPLNQADKKTTGRTSRAGKISEEDIKRFKEILLTKRQQLIGDMDHLTEGRPENPGPSLPATFPACRFIWRTSAAIISSRNSALD